MPNGFEEYGDIFEQRGHRYHAAMCACPHARDAELEAAVAWSDLRAGQVLCDVPSGAGYLRRFVDTRVTVVHLETSAVFARLGHAQAAPVALGAMYDLPLRTAGADRVLSLAALPRRRQAPVLPRGFSYPATGRRPVHRRCRRRFAGRRLPERVRPWAQLDGTRGAVHRP